MDIARRLAETSNFVNWRGIDRLSYGPVQTELGCGVGGPRVGDLGKLANY